MMKNLFLPHFRTRIDEEAQVIELDVGPGAVQLPHQSDLAQRSVGSQGQVRKFCGRNNYC